MAYRINIPQATDRINDSQPLILGNFNEINTDFLRNHVGLLDATVANRGKHALVQFVTQVPGVVPAVSATEIGMYNKVPEAPFPLTGLQEMFVKRAGASPIDVPITAKLFTAGTRGWTYLPSGLVLKFGTGTSGASRQGTINLDQAPFFDGVHYISIPFAQVTAFTLAGPEPQFASISNATTAAQLICHTSSANSPFSWFTIGEV